MRQILLIHTAEDFSYLKGFKSSYLPANWTLHVVPDYKIGTSFLNSNANQHFDAIVSDSPSAVGRAFANKATCALDNYVGSFKHLESNGLPFLVLPPLCNKYVVPHQNFLVERLIKKITKPQDFIAADKFSFKSPADRDFFAAIQAAIRNAVFMAIDLETSEAALKIDDCGIACWNPRDGSQVFSWSIHDEADLALLRQACDSPAIKIFQNGKYDCHYLFRFNCWPRNWKLDTLNMFHCWLAELPKDLGFISAFCVRDFYYWKDERKATTKIEQLQYNAKDCWATLWSAIALMKEMPAWARRNYGIEFPKVYPNLSSSLQGMRVDLPVREALIKKADADIARRVAELRTMVGNQDFNPNSSQQVVKLLKVLGVKDTSSADTKHIVKARAEHPLNDRILSVYAPLKKQAKINSTYYKASLLGGRLLWQLNEAKTDTGRNSCDKSSFWCGTQMQNQPEGAKVMYLADEGWTGGEADFSQAESGATGYLADDEKLIYAVEKSPDFHSFNASAFFGIPFEQLWDTDAGKTLNKKIRDLSKRVNHGANYNMGEQVLVDTMGVAAIWEAHRLLGLAAKFPRLQWTTLKIAAYLLKQFELTYPKIRGDFQQEIIQEIALTGRLTSVRGWTRKVFGDPSKSKMALNAVVAHGPQNLSAGILNDAYERAWFELHDIENFKLIVTIHDSILFQYRGEVGAAKVQRLKEIMTIPVVIPKTGKTLVIHPAIEIWGSRWKELKA